MKTNLKQLMLLACFMLSFVACTIDSGDNPAKGIDTRIVGNWFSDVSGMTYAKWNYGKTWQNTEFKADGTGSTRIYYTFEDDVIGCEKIDFTYTASANGVLTMNPKDREKSQIHRVCIWQCGWHHGFYYRTGLMGETAAVPDRPQQRARGVHV